MTESNKKSMKYTREDIESIYKQLPHGAITAIAKKLKLPWSTVKDSFVSERSRSRWANSRSKDKERIYKEAEKIIKVKRVVSNK